MGLIAYLSLNFLYVTNYKYQEYPPGNDRISPLKVAHMEDEGPFSLHLTPHAPRGLQPLLAAGASHQVEDLGILDLFDPEGVAVFPTDVAGIRNFRGIRNLVRIR